MGEARAYLRSQAERVASQPNERRTRELAASASPDLVIWSEGIYPWIRTPAEIARQFGRPAGVPLIFGSLGPVGEQISNRAYVSFDPGAIPEYYDKRALMSRSRRVSGGQKSVPESKPKTLLPKFARCMRRV